MLFLLPPILSAHSFCFLPLLSFPSRCLPLHRSLANNRFVAIPSLESNTQLEMLDLSNNLIRTIPSSLKKNTALTVLYVTISVPCLQSLNQ